MHWSAGIPDKPGKYIVQTKSNILGRIRTMDATLSFNDKGKPSWSFTNQTFYKVLIKHFPTGCKLCGGRQFKTTKDYKPAKKCSECSDVVFK